MKTRTRALLPVTAVALAVLAACGSAPAAAPPPPPPAAASANPHEGMDMSGMEGMEGMQHGPPGDGLELWAVQTGPLGVTVTDGTGALLYRSDRDTNQPPTTTCTDACLASWQPVVEDAGQPPSLLGVNDSDVGTVARPDGTQQLTIGGWPIYRHVGDKQGLTDTEANGADGVWFVVSPTGGKAKPTA